MANFIWVASYPKSGNTWTRAFLMHLFMNSRGPVALDEVGAMTVLDAAIYWFDQATGEERGRYKAEEAAALRVAAQRELLKLHTTSAFVKTHSALMPWHGHPMFDMANTAGGIYIVRNPLDIVASYAHHGGHSFEYIIKVMNSKDYVTTGSTVQVPQLLGSWSQNVASWTARPNPAIHVMRYEDMVDDPVGTFGGLTKFLKLDPPAERLERAIQLCSFDSLKQIEAAEGFDEKTEHQSSFFRKGRTGGWREELTPDQARRIVDTHRQQMMRFGYVPEGM